MKTALHPAAFAATDRADELISASSLPASGVHPPHAGADLLLPILQRIDALSSRVERMAEITEVLMDRITDTSHLSLDEIARMQDISKTSARRRYAQWLEEIPGTRRRGVPRHRVVDGWVPRRTLRAAKKGAAK